MSGVWWATGQQRAGGRGEPGAADGGESGAHQLLKPRGLGCLLLPLPPQRVRLLRLRRGCGAFSGGTGRAHQTFPRLRSSVTPTRSKEHQAARRGRTARLRARAAASARAWSAAILSASASAWALARFASLLDADCSCGVGGGGGSDGGICCGWDDPDWPPLDTAAAPTACGGQSRGKRSQEVRSSSRLTDHQGVVETKRNEHGGGRRRPAPPGSTSARGPRAGRFPPAAEAATERLGRRTAAC